MQNTSAFPSKNSFVPPQKSSAEDIAEKFPSEPPTHVVDDVFPQAVDSKSRTKEGTIGFSDGKDDEHSDTDDIADEHEHRNELVFLLDELLWQDGINQDEYTQLNTMLTESLDEDENEENIESTKDKSAESTTMENETREGKLKKITRSTVKYMIELSNKRCCRIFSGYSPRIGATGWCLSIYEFIDSESVLTEIDELWRKLDSSAAIQKSKQHRLHILSKDMNQNRHRVQTILKLLFS